MSNAKGQLQEILQQKRCPLPTYRVTSSGPSHCPTLVCTATVRYGGKEMREEVWQTGGKKKDVEKVAAEKMLRRIQQEGKTDMATPRSESSQSTRRHSVSPAPSAKRVCPSVTARSASLSPHGLARSPSPSAPQDRSPVSLLQERLQGMTLSPPQYKEVRSSPSLFRVQCVVCNSRQQPVLESKGEGRSKKTAKDAAARDMLQKMNAVPLERLSPVISVTVVPEVVDPELDDDIAINLSSYSPKYHFWQCPGEVHATYLHAYSYASCTHTLQVCSLVWVEGVRSYPVAGHGRGSDKAAAKREASCNLLANLSILENSPSIAMPITDS